MKKEEEKLEKLIEELKKDVGGLQDAVKEGTKELAKLVGEWEKWRKAGKF